MICGSLRTGSLQGTPTFLGSWGQRLSLPVEAVPPEELMDHFGWLGIFASVDMPASSRITQEKLSWNPRHTSLIADIATDAQLGGPRSAEATPEVRNCPQAPCVYAR